MVRKLDFGQLSGVMAEEFQRMFKNSIDSDLLLIQAGRWENNSWA